MRKFLCFLTTILLINKVFGSIDSIAGGALAKKGQFPFFAEIFIGYYRTLDNYMAAGCGGSLIQPRWILTAAHCFKKEEEVPYEMFTLNNVIAYMGSEKTNPFDQNDVFVRFVHKAYIHNDYVYQRIAGAEYLECDIALAELRKPFTFSIYITIIPLPDETTTLCKNGVIVGRGITRFTGQKSMPIEYAYVTVKSLKGLSSPPKYYRKNIFHSEVYWYKDHPLQGDPGGPFICYNNLKSILYGVISTYYNNTFRGTTIAQYESVDKYLDFINRHVKSDTARIYVPETWTRGTKEAKPVNHAIILKPDYLTNCWSFTLLLILLDFC